MNVIIRCRVCHEKIHVTIRHVVYVCMREDECHEKIHVIIRHVVHVIIVMREDGTSLSSSVEK